MTSNCLLTELTVQTSPWAYGVLVIDYYRSWQSLQCSTMETEQLNQLLMVVGWKRAAVTTIYNCQHKPHPIYYGVCVACHHMMLLIYHNYIQLSI